MPAFSMMIDRTAVVESAEPGKSVDVGLAQSCIQECNKWDMFL